jgi:putative membrane-bound dehydrogenase-like protein
MRPLSLFPLLLCLAAAGPARAADGNRLVYLDSNDPYYVSREFPKLATPQWVGEADVEAVAVLAIDDMRGHEKWEAYLRPILERLKRIGGRAPVSIMTCQIDPADPHLQRWLAEGVSLETHTIDHPCPLLAGGDLAKAKSTYDRCIELLASVPGNRPVAFRVPCCDSMNSPSPRFYAEIFNRTTPQGRFLAIDSSVMQVFTANDAALPRELVQDADGRERFRKFVPADRSFVNTVDDYCYPYSIGRLCWEFPCVMPSDWDAQFLQKPNNPRTVADLQAAIDATVIKQGTFNLIFHPHGWIRNDQIVALIDHALAKHGGKIKFLNFREALERIEKNLLAGQSLRAADGGDNGVRLIDLNQDGYVDVVIGNEKLRQTRVWSPQARTWKVTEFPVQLVEIAKDGRRQDTGARFGVVDPAGRPMVLVRNERTSGAWRYDGEKWVADASLLAGLELDGKPVLTNRQGKDRGVRLRDLDRDGRCELLVGNDSQNAVFAYDARARAWRPLPCKLPAGTAIVDAQGRDAGLRFVDVDEDAYDDVVFSNERSYSLDLFRSLAEGWSRRVLAGRAGQDGGLPMIARDGTNNGVWFHSGHMWAQNETTDRMKNVVDRRALADLLKDVEPEAKSPQASLRSLRLRPGFTAELVASEPLIEDPVAFDWGPDGKLWVAEMHDYPEGLADQRHGADGKGGRGKPGGRVKFLEDTDGDGRYDRATLFLDGLNFPNGVMAWGKGVLVTAAPEILYAEDTDGDGRADLRRALFKGFGEGNQQHRVNGLRLGLDNWIYCANGDSGGTIVSLKTGKEAAITFQDFRIRPDDGALETQIGESQFIRERDDWGNWFGSQNSDPMFQFVLDSKYLGRNLHVTTPPGRIDVSDAPGAAPVFPASRTLPRFNDFNTANRFTSACSAIVYRDDLLGEALAGNAFVCEPVHNLVHREVMRREGVTFHSRRAADEQQSEFLASSDNWFRPVMVRTGPDGALWVADMYRAVIEHPEYIPKDWQKRLDLRAGDTMGRIYRVYPVGRKPRPIPRLDKLDAAGLVAALDNPSGAARDMVQQLLVARQNRASAPLLKKAAGDSPRATARLQALCALDGLHALDVPTLIAGLKDREPGVRRHAARLSEPLLAKSPELANAVLKLAADDDPFVRLQVAYSLGAWPDDRAGAALGEILLGDAGDRYISAAALSSVSERHLDAALATVLGPVDRRLTRPLPKDSLAKLVVVAAAYKNEPALAKILDRVSQSKNGAFETWQTATLAELLDLLGRHNQSLVKLRDEASGELRNAIDRLSPLFDAARRVVADPASGDDQRLAMLPLLAKAPANQQADVDLLASLLVPSSSTRLQSAAIAALSRVDDDRAAKLMLANWSSYAPTTRGDVLDALMRQTTATKDLLAGIAAGRIALADLDASHRQRLLDEGDDGNRKLAARLLGSAGDSNRQAVIDEFRAAVSTGPNAAGGVRKGDPKQGAAVFKKRCAVCHRLDDVGTPVGPDLAALSDKSPDYLLVAILDPNRAVESKFVSYSAQTKSGLIHTGIMTEGSGNSITLMGQEGKQTTILRADLDALASSGKSLMPEGLEKDVSHQEVADLLAYLAGTKAPRRVFDGNEPKLIEPEGFRGEFWLLASNSEIYGSTLVFEPLYRNLGFWSSENDHAVWTMNVTKAGRYIVRLDCACPPESAGNAYVLSIDDVTLSGKVPSTGNWDTYRQISVGTVTLKPGRKQLALRPAGKINGNLMDLKSVRVTPVETD